MPPSSSTTEPERRIELGLIAAAALLILVWLPDLGGHLARLDHCPYLACDFQAVYLPQARRLYEGFVHTDWTYPPLLAILLQPLAFLPPAAAVWAWEALLGGALLLLAWLCAEVLSGPDEGRARWRARGAGLALCLLCLPVIHGLKWGQVSLPLAAGAILALRRGGAWAGLIGLGGAIKLYPAAWMIGAWRDRRALVVGAGALAAGLLLPALLIPGEQMARFADGTLRHQLANHAGALRSAAELGGQGLEVSLRRWFVDGSTFGDPDHGPLIVSLPGLFLKIGLLPLVGLWAGARGAGAAGPDRDLRIVHLLCGLTLALQPAWHHYFSFLPFVWAVGLRRGSRAITLLSVALGAAPLFAHVWAPKFYYAWTAAGGTTAAALMGWLGAAWPGAAWPGAARAGRDRL